MLVVSSCGGGRQSLRGHHQCSKGNKHRHGTTRQPGLQAHPRVSPSWEQGADKPVLHTQIEGKLHHAEAPRQSGGWLK